MFEDKQSYTKIVYGIIKKVGKYISKSSVNEFYTTDTPTASYASSVFYSNDHEDVELVKEILSSMKDRDLLSEVRDYWISLYENSNETDDGYTFTHNVVTALKMVEIKDGLIAYALYKYMNEVEDFTGRKALKAKSENSNYIGNVGEKIKNVNVELINVFYFETVYGVSAVVTMIDDNGNVIVWKTASSPVSAEDRGNKMTIKTAIVKDHSEYHGTRQTSVKNLKFI
jgi:hypothetical protein